MSTFSKIRPLNDFSQSLPSNDNEASADYKGNSTVRLNKDKLPIFNLSKHFNFRTAYGRANVSYILFILKKCPEFIFSILYLSMNYLFYEFQVSKATYAGILIYYIYKKVKNNSTQ